MIFNPEIKPLSPLQKPSHPAANSEITQSPALSTNRSSTAHWLWVVPVLLLTAWLGARGLNADAIWYDEWLTTYYAGGAHYGPVAPAETWARVEAQSTWPPGFPMLYAAWGAVFGWHHAVGRVISLFAGVLAVAFVYRMGRDMASPLVGLGAAVMVGTSAFFVYYLHELRGYSLTVSLGALCAWAYWRITYRRGGYAFQAAFFGSVVALLYLNYFAALTAVMIGVYHLIFVRKNRAWWRIPALIAAASITFLPWVNSVLFTAGRVFSSEHRYVVNIRADAILSGLAYTFSNGSAALLALLLIMSLRGRKAALFGWIWLGLGLALVLSFNERIQLIFHIRHLLPWWPALALLAALGVEQLAKRGIRPIYILGIWLAAGLWNVFDVSFIQNQRGQEPTLPWDSLSPILERLAADSTPDDLAVFHVEVLGRDWLTEPIIDYYLYPIPASNTQFEQVPGFEANDDYYSQALDAIDKAPRVWTVIMPSVPMSYHVPEFRRALARDYADCGTVVTTPAMLMNLYLRNPEDDDLAGYFDEDIGLQLARPLPEVVTLESPLQIAIGWQVQDGVPPDTYSVGLHLTDAFGSLVGQSDYGLPDAGWNCRTSTIDISRLTPGEYQVAVIVYNWQDGTRLKSSGEDVLILGKVKIEG